MCKCINELRENTKLTDGVICIVADIAYEPKFFQKLSTVQVGQKCFTTVNQGCKQLSTVTKAPGKHEGKTLTIADPILADCVGCRSTVMIGGVRYHVTAVDGTTVTAEVIGTQSTTAIIPAGTEVCVMGNAEDLCTFDSICSDFDTACHENAIQTVSDCFQSCEGEQTLSRIGGLQDSTNVDADKARAMFKKHLIKLDMLAMFGWYSKELSKGTHNYSMGGYDYHVMQYGIVTDKSEVEATKDCIIDWACEMGERDVQADCVYMHPRTWKCIQSIYESGCIGACNAPGTTNGTVGSINRFLLLDGFDSPLQVITWSKIPVGEVIPVDTNNVQLATYSFQGGGNYIGRLVDVVPCGGGNRRYDYKSNISLKVLDPYRTAKLVLNIC